MKPSRVLPCFRDVRSVVGSMEFFSRRTDLNPAEKEAIDLLRVHGTRLHELDSALTRAVWDLFTLGGEKRSAQRSGESKKAFEARLREIQAKCNAEAVEKEVVLIDYKNDPKNADPVISVHKSKDEIRNPFIRKQIDDAHIVFSESGVDAELEKQIAKNAADLDTMYGDFTSVFKGEKLSNEQIESRLGRTKGRASAHDAIDLVKARLAIGHHRLDGKGPTVAELILETIKLRNQFARKAGAPNYYSYSLVRQGINEDDLVRLQEEVKRELKPMYRRLRDRMDKAAMKRYGISKEEARLPWFQRGVSTFKIVDDVMSFDPDKHFEGIDPSPVMKSTARKIGSSATRIVNKSDLFPRPGKTPHWYMFPLSVPDDIRTIGNIDPHFKTRMGYTFSTELHEVIGHGVGFSFIDPVLPPLFKSLDTITTESDAMMMEDLMYNKHWLKEIANFDDATIDLFLTDGKQYRLAEQLVSFFQNFLLIPDVEREMYHMSDNELTLKNVNKLWREKVEEYLGIKIPKDRDEPDWTYKIHFANAPVYYQNYFLGQLARAQNYARLNELNGSRGLLSQGTGEFLRTYRGVGEAYRWDELVEYQTGKPLSVDALKREFEDLKI